jgi:hypothetical protein
MSSYPKCEWMRCSALGTAHAVCVIPTPVQPYGVTVNRHLCAKHVAGFMKKGWTSGETVPSAITKVF